MKKKKKKEKEPRYLCELEAGRENEKLNRNDFAHESEEGVASTSTMRKEENGEKAEDDVYKGKEEWCLK